MEVAPKKELSLFDSTCIIVGIIIGAGIYQMAPDIARGAHSWWGVLAIWLVGGLLSLFGALGYAELATAYPQEGGDYVYLSRAYGRWAGFLFGWIQLAIVRPGDIAVMAFAFAIYARTIYDPLAAYPEYSQRVFAAVAVVILTVINILGVKAGKWTQNLLTTVKALGLLAIVAVALIAPENPGEKNSVCRGVWSIVSLTKGDSKYVEEDKGAQASITFSPLGAGKFELRDANDLGDIKATIEHQATVRNGRSSVQFSFKGEVGKGPKESMVGKGWASPIDKNNNRLSGELYINDGEKFGFEAKRIVLPVSLALIFVLFTFGGWNEMAYVAAEVKNSRRNIVRALVLGTGSVTILYLLINSAFLYVIGYYGLTASNAVATDSVSVLLPKIGASLISALVCISALGAANGLIFTGARISYALGAEHRAFGILGRWDQRRGTPVWALLLQGAIAVGLIVVLGSFVNTILYTAAPVYSFYLATSLAVIVLRFKEKNTERPYRVTGYPVTTIVFCAVCAFLIYSAIDYKPWIAATACVVLLVGIILYWLTDGPRGKSG